MRLDRARLERLVVLGGVLLAACLLCWHATRYLPFIADDSLISLRYSQRLLEGHGLTWTGEERVEGYSNLLWVLACAALGSMGLDLVLAARILGTTSAVAAVAAIVLGAGSMLHHRASAIAPAIAFGLAGPVAVWAIGGLEQPLVAALLAWGLALALPLAAGPVSRRRLAGAGVCFALLCLTRPDAPLFVACIAAAIFLARRFARDAFADALRLCVLPVLAVATQLAFRLAYYGDWVANTARAKVAFSWTRALDGWRYVEGGLLWLGGLTVLALLSLAAVRDRERRGRLLLAALPLVAWLSYVATVGGDIFPARRHFVPAIVLLAFLAAEGIDALVSRAGGWRWAAVGAAALGLAALGYFQWRDPENLRAVHERWEWDGQVLGGLLQRAFADEEPLVAVDSAGCIPYFSGLPSLDMLGLNDRWLAHHPPPGFGTGPLAHELGDGDYVLSRAPDLLVFCHPGGSDRACFRSGRELQRKQAFRTDYLAVTLEGRDPYPHRSRVWVRREGRIGVTHGRDQVEIPGFLFALKAVARLDAAGRLGTALKQGEQASLSLEVPAGRWRAEIAGEGDVEVDLRRRASRPVIGRMTALGAGGRLEIRLLATSAEAHVRAVTLLRAEAEAQPTSMVP